MSAVLLRKRRLKLGQAALLFLVGLAPGVAFAVPPSGDGQVEGTRPDFVLLNPRYYGDAIPSANPAKSESAINLGNAAMTLVTPASGKGAENLPVPSFAPLGETADRQAGRPSSDSYAAWGIDGPPLPLPLPKIKIKPVALTMASPIQVSAASKGAAGTKASPANPALTLSPKAAQKAASVAPVKASAGAASVPTAATTASGATTAQVASQPQRTQTPTPQKSSGTGIQTVKDAAPIHRTSQPATDKVPASLAAAPSPSPAASNPQSGASASPLGVVADPHSLPEYSLVQPVAQPASPAPVGSLAPNVLNLSGIQGSTVDVNLPGRGWIYTGTGQTPAGVSFMEKSAQASSERFRFRMDATGLLSLQFQRQDLSSGLVERGVANISVSAKGPQFSAANTGILPINASVSGTQGAGQSTAYQPQFPVPGERSIRPQTANNSANLNGANNVAYAPQVPNAGLQQLAAVPDPSPAPEIVPTDAPGIFAFAQAKAQAKAWTDARTLYEKILKDFPAFEKTDEVMYRLAQLLESNSDQRSLKDAYALYVRIQNEYPYGAWVDPAKERARYISRTFFRP